MSECITIVSAETMYGHLQQYFAHRSIRKAEDLPRAKGYGTGHSMGECIAIVSAYTLDRHFE